MCVHIWIATCTNVDARVFGKRQIFEAPQWLIICDEGIAHVLLHRW